MMKITSFRGDLTDISARNEALMRRPPVSVESSDSSAVSAFWSERIGREICIAGSDSQVVFKRSSTLKI